MIFLTVTVLGAFVGGLIGRMGRAGRLAADTAAVAGAAGAFVAGGIVVGLIERRLSALDPLVLGVGALAAVAFAVAIGHLGGAGPDQGRRAARRSKMGSGLYW